jgi:hypothetical protein
MIPRIPICLAASAVSGIIIPHAMADTGGISATLIGENYCLHCSLVMDGDGDAACGPETCSYALRVEEALDEQGQPIKELEGVTLHYVKSEASKGLLSDEALFGEDVQIEGTVFTEEHALDVKNAELYDEFALFEELELDPTASRASARR